MELKTYMEVTGYRITEGSDYCWQCFGPNAYRLDSWSGAWDNSTEDYTIGIVFDTITQIVYQVEAHDYCRNRSYRWTNPKYKADHDSEAAQRNIDPKEAYDDVNFVDLEVEADFWEKARAIVSNEDYDTRVQIEVEFDDDVLLAAMKLAHEKDVTFNELVEQVLRDQIEKLKGENNE